MDPYLVERARTGDEGAFEALSVTWHPRLFQVADGFLRDAALAEDATQRACLEAWRWLPRLDEPEHVDGWAVGHLVQACRSLEAVQPDDVEQDESTEPFVPYATEPLGAFVDRDQLSRGFRQLDFDDRAVLVLRLLAEMDEEDVGVALGLKADAVGAQVESALEALDGLLDGDAAPASELTPQMEGA